MASNFGITIDKNSDGFGALRVEKAIGMLRNFPRTLSGRGNWRWRPTETLTFVWIDY